jgi:hypothetical protein
LSLMRTTKAMLQVKYIAATVGYPRILAVNALLVCQYCAGLRFCSLTDSR